MVHVFTPRCTSAVEKSEAPCHSIEVIFLTAMDDFWHIYRMSEDRTGCSRVQFFVAPALRVSLWGFTFQTYFIQPIVLNPSNLIMLNYTELASQFR
jgi:hypothetical protein